MKRVARLGPNLLASFYSDKANELTIKMDLMVAEDASWIATRYFHEPESLDDQFVEDVKKLLIKDFTRAWKDSHAWALAQMLCETPEEIPRLLPHVSNRAKEALLPVLEGKPLLTLRDR